MISPTPGSISMFAAGCKRAMNVIRGKLPGANKIARYESAPTLEAAMIGIVFTAVACDEFGQQYAGIRLTPRSFYAIKGRLDEKVWIHCAVEDCSLQVRAPARAGSRQCADGGANQTQSREKVWCDIREDNEERTGCGLQDPAQHSCTGAVLH
jgi:hypothetical protein